MTSPLIQTMISKAKQALSASYSPYSRFAVACCIATDKDELFTGVNVENASYALCICAEAAAICQMVAAGHQTIKYVVIMNNNNTLCPPCGACRQRLLEFSKDSTLVYLTDEKQILHTASMETLLPLPFTLTPLNQDLPHE